MFRLFDTLLFTIERIRQHLLLVMWVIVGLSIATTLSLSLSLYVDSVYSELLESRLEEPPFGFRFRYLGAWNGNIERADVESATGTVENRFIPIMGLPPERDVSFVRGGTWNLRFAEGAGLGAFGLGVLHGADNQMMITAGEWPSTPTDDDAIPVLMAQEQLFMMGIQVGDEFVAQRPGGGTFNLRVAALWKPINPNDPSWIFTPKFFDDILLVSDDSFWQMLDGIAAPIDESAWYLVFDGEQVRTSDVSTLLASAVDGRRSMENALPGIRQDISPEDGLTDFNDEVSALTQQLFIIIAPVGGLVLYFVAMVAGLLVSRQQTEDVKLRSRGMSRGALLTVHVLMWLLLVGVALAVGVAVAPPVVRLVGQTTSFLRFDGINSVQTIVITSNALLLGALTGVIAASSGLFLAWRTTCQNINSYRQLHTQVQKTWWQRAYLDFALLAVAIYVLYTLTARGGLVTDADEPFADPLTFAGPTLFALGGAFFFLRVWPTLMHFSAGFISYSSNMALLMALRELTRSIGRYRGSLLMMAFTLSLTGFTASMASTIDLSLEDTINYRIGADLVIVTATDAQTDQNTDNAGALELIVTGYNIPPTEELFLIDGVTNVSRVGRYNGRVQVGNQFIDGTILGIDRGALAAVTRFRQDFAHEPLATIMNKLAGNRTGIILNRQMAEQHGLLIRQEISMQVEALGTFQQARVPIIDFVDFFPTLDPADGFFLITNIDPVFETAGTVLPHDIWLSIDPAADRDAVREQIMSSNFPVLELREPEIEMEIARAAPARRGVLGFLSVGFVAAITLTLIATVIQSTASFRAQSAQLGVLRAMGMGGLSVGMYVILLQGIAAVSSILSGTTIGVLTTLLFLPLLDFSSGLPPYLVRVAWDDITIVYVVFAGVLLFTTLFTTIVLSREQVSTIIRLGE